jgi:hypothetical protein
MVKLTVLNGSQLAIGSLPMFRYNPQWSHASGWSQGPVVRVEGRRLHVAVDVATAHMPSQSCCTTFLEALWPLPVPAFPPGVSIQMVPLRLQGYIDLETREVALEFESAFRVALLGAPCGTPLTVATTLTTAASTGDHYKGTGSPLADDGTCKLVGVARVPPTQAGVQNWLLGLPTDAFSMLRVQFQFVVATEEEDGPVAMTAGGAAGGAGEPGDEGAIPTGNNTAAVDAVALGSGAEPSS